MRISFKSGCVVWVAKHLKRDWVIVTIMALKNLVSFVKSCIANIRKAGLNRHYYVLAT